MEILFWKTGLGLSYSEPPTNENGEWIHDHPNQIGYGSISGVAVCDSGNLVLVGAIAGGSGWPMEWS
jgi:hypothetical protein